MPQQTWHLALPFLLLAITPIACAAANPVQAERAGDKWNITLDDKPFAVHVLGTEQDGRPHIAPIHAPGGPQVTRNYPPIQGKDSDDHPTFHTGIFFTIDNINGNDYWRRKAKAITRDSSKRPDPAGVTIEDEIEYLAADDDKTIICTEHRRTRYRPAPAGGLISLEVNLIADHDPITIGDSEEVGFAVRIAAPMQVDRGGTILNSNGQRNQKEVWGKIANWCDYTGTADGKTAGVTLMPHPKNFRPCWFHARDYGILLANPFGQRAYTKTGDGSVTVKKGETLILRFAAYIHNGSPEFANVAKVYADYIAQ
jgi:hypothetical protein